LVFVSNSYSDSISKVVKVDGSKYDKHSFYCLFSFGLCHLTLLPSEDLRHPMMIIKDNGKSIMPPQNRHRRG
jgi:hypothetical protein